tara:strand:+ start:328 stop:513 length:186 start_codon:yes stop_codon:yes gene_type:complete
MTRIANLAAIVTAWSWSAPSPKSLEDEERWKRDPLSHPAIRRMSSLEIADLPFDSSKITSE